MQNIASVCACTVYFHLLHMFWVLSVKCPTTQGKKSKCQTVASNRDRAMWDRFHLEASLWSEAMAWGAGEAIPVFHTWAAVTDFRTRPLGCSLPGQAFSFISCQGLPSLLYIRYARVGETAPPCSRFTHLFHFFFFLSTQVLYNSE